MPEGAFKPRLVKPSVDRGSQATQPVSEQPVANDNKAWTEEEEKFFAQGEARNKADEAERARRAEYDAAQAKLKKHAEGRQ